MARFTFSMDEESGCGKCGEPLKQSNPPELKYILDTRSGKTCSVQCCIHCVREIEANERALKQLKAVAPVTPVTPIIETKEPEIANTKTTKKSAIKTTVKRKVKRRKRKTATSDL